MKKGNGLRTTQICNTCGSEFDLNTDGLEDGAVSPCAICGKDVCVECRPNIDAYKTYTSLDINTMLSVLLLSVDICEGCIENFIYELDAESLSFTEAYFSKYKVKV